jgi:flavin reductase (DIM6/NTAB) family NADH-FMN oxidoreductase RutF
MVNNLHHEQNEFNIFIMAKNSENQSTDTASDKIDPRGFRQALGHFATGVTVITAQSPGGDLVGITANSFNSVSLDPPMVLWSLSRASEGFDLFTAAEHFCVNILADDQVELSNHFAAKKLDKFSSVKYEPGIGGSPVLDDTAANFQCKTSFTYEGGDHLIFVGEVLAFNDTGKQGLLYHQGKYAVSDVHPFHAKDSSDSAATGFVDDYLDYLLSSAAQSSL